MNPAATLAEHRTFAWEHREGRERVVLAVATGASLERLERSLPEWLSEREAARIARAVAKRRAEYLLGRYAAKSALAVWNGAGVLRDFTILPGAFDQPVVEGPSPADVTLAHTADLAVALAHPRGHPMGIDVETIDPGRTDVLRTQVAPSELPSSAPGSEAETLFLLWSAKEALSKALRCGLTCPCDILATARAAFGSDGTCSGEFAQFGQYRFLAWLAGGRAFALVGSRRAAWDGSVLELVAFTRSIPPATAAENVIVNGRAVRSK